MHLILKGLTKTATILNLQGLVHTYVFDLRPKSFNFTSFKNIENVCENFSHENYRLLLSGTEDVLTIQESFQRVTDKYDKVELEFSHNSNLKELEKLNLSYAWHFDEETSFDDIRGAKQLSTIILSHSYLEKLSASQKLFDFLRAFESSEFSHLKFELSLKWNCLLYTSPSPRDRQKSRMPSSA